jgi:hypothetical protein
MRRVVAVLIVALAPAAAPLKAPPANESYLSVPLWVDPSDTRLSATDLSAFI